MVQSVERLTSAQVTISQLVSSSPNSGSVLTAQSLEPLPDSVSPSLSLPLPHPRSVSVSLKKKQTLKKKSWGAWVAQSVEWLTSAQVTISQLLSSSPASGSLLTAWSLEPASDSVSPSLCPLPAPLLTLCLSLSLSQK